jgi:PPK2 family polyphosphate:nucleotide phosphotransferase
MGILSDAGYALNPEPWSPTPPMFDSPYLVQPGKKFKLADRKTNDTGPFKDKEEAEPVTRKTVAQLHEMQDELYAGAKHALLIVFQAMDAGGKDGAIDHIFSGVNPQGCMVSSFKRPTSEELSHDFLWRIHAAAPRKGMIGIFNRSHYESVLVERVRKLVPKDAWSDRYEHIRNFEKMLADEGTTILKFFLHISKDEQKERLESRLKDPSKNWKFDPGDLAERKLWDDYQEAYQDALRETSMKYAPWYVVPADRKWFRNWVISETIVQTMKDLDLKFPPPVEGLEKIVVE